MADTNSKLIIAKRPMDFTNAVSVNGFDITGDEPEKTKRSLLWKIDDVWNKLVTTDDAVSLSKAATQTLTADSVLTEGNSVQELLTMKSVPPFVGKLVYPALSMSAETDAQQMPSIKMTVPYDDALHAEDAEEKPDNLI